MLGLVLTEKKELLEFENLGEICYGIFGEDGQEVWPWEDKELAVFVRDGLIPEPYDWEVAGKIFQGPVVIVHSNLWDLDEYLSLTPDEIQFLSDAKRTQGE